MPTSSSSLSSASDSVSSTSTVSCFFDPSTCQYQSFSIPEKIVFYMAKNCRNAETFKKLVQTCKYFFKVNPVIVVRLIFCSKSEWCASYNVNVTFMDGFKYDQLNFKIWLSQCFACTSGNAAQIIPWIYKNDVTDVVLLSKLLRFGDFLFLAGNVEKLTMTNHLIKYENGKTVQLEEIVKNLPKLKILDFYANDGGDVNCNTARKLMEIQHFKNLLRLELDNISEELDVVAMFKYIIENKHVEVDLYYRDNISDACKELIREYSNLLKNEDGCNSKISYYPIYIAHETSSSDDDSFDGDDNVSDADENKDLLFPNEYGRK